MRSAMGSCRLACPLFALQWRYAVSADARLRNGRPAGGDVAGDGQGEALDPARAAQAGFVPSLVTQHLPERTGLEDSDVRAASSLKWDGFEIRFTGRSAASFSGTDFKSVLPGKAASRFPGAVGGRARTVSRCCRGGGWRCR